MTIHPITDKLTRAGIEYREMEPLSLHTSFRIGGPARLAVFPKNDREVIEALRAIGDFPLAVLGNGSNVLADDAGFDGAALILTGLNECTADGVTLRAGAGVPLTRLAAEAAKHSLAGVAFAYGIPGTVGGGIYMNAGAYGGEMAQITSVSRWIDRRDGSIGCFLGTEHDFGYRHSAYMGGDKILLSADFTLTPGDRKEIEDEMHDYLSRRREKQPLEYPSAGSVFKRGNGFFTSQLIDEAGLKGRTVGGAQVSEKHAGFIINRGGATAADVLALIDIIKTELDRQFGVEIECEIRRIG